MKPVLDETELLRRRDIVRMLTHTKEVHKWTSIQTCDNQPHGTRPTHSLIIIGQMRGMLGVPQGNVHHHRHHLKVAIRLHTRVGGWGRDGIVTHSEQMNNSCLVHIIFQSGWRKLSKWHPAPPLPWDTPPKRVGPAEHLCVSQLAFSARFHRGIGESSHQGEVLREGGRHIIKVA